MKRPLVSIIITTKNNERTIGPLLKSINFQTYKQLEVVVVDNKSTDKTVQIARSYKATCITKGPERSAQRNAGVKKSKGDYILILDSDMMLSKNVVSECIATIQKNEKVHALNIPEESFGEGFWAECKKLERSFYMGSNNIGWMQGARFFRRNTFIQMDGYDEDNTGTEDFDLPQRIIHAYGNQSIKTIKSLIYHDEGRLSLLNTLKKKYYYAKRLRSYFSKQENREYFNKQSNILLRYRVYLARPVLLMRNPVVGIGMLSMKTLEFISGALGYYLNKSKT